MPRFMPWCLWSQEKFHSRPSHLPTIAASRKSFASAVARAPLLSCAAPKPTGKKERRAMKNVRAVTEPDVLTIKVDMSDAVKEFEEKAEQLRSQWEESEWSLGEARASESRLERQLDEVREANRYLGELRAIHEALRQETRELIEQLAQTRKDVEVMRRVAEARQGDVDVERARRRAVEASLHAIQRHGERRAAVRRHLPDLVAEVRGPDGLLLFHGCPPNVSLTGLAFATGQSVDAAPDFVEITLHIPALGQPIEGVGRLVWREAMEGSHQWGCELLDLLPDSRKGLEDVLANAA